MQLHATLLGLLLAGACALGAHPPAETSLDSTAQLVGGRTFSSAALFFSRAAAVRVRLDVSLNAPETVLADRAGLPWGVDCSPANDCAYVGEETATGFAYRAPYIYRPAAVHLRPSPEQLGAESAPLAARLMQRSDKWVPREWGLLGLAPHGDFASYARALYDADLSLVLAYRAADGADGDSRFSPYIAVHPTYDEKQVVDTLAMGRDAAFWTVHASAYLGEQQIASSASTCLTNYGDEALYVDSAGERCRDVQRAVCGGKVSNACTRAAADMQAAPALRVSMQAKEYAIPADQYLYFDAGEVLQCRFADVSVLKGAVACAPATELGLGKGFFAVYTPVVQFGKDGETRMVLLRDYRPPAAINVALWTGVVGLAALLAVAVLVRATCLRKAAEGDEDVYFATQ